MLSWLFILQACMYDRQMFILNFVEEPSALLMWDVELPGVSRNRKLDNIK